MSIVRSDVLHSPNMKMPQPKWQNDLMAKLLKESSKVRRNGVFRKSFCHKIILLSFFDLKTKEGRFEDTELVGGAVVSSAVLI